MMMFGEIIKGVTESLNSGGEHICFAAETDAKIIRHPKEPSGDHAGFIFVTQQLAELVDASGFESRKRNCSVVKARGLQIGTFIKKTIEQGVICRQQFARALAYA